MRALLLAALVACGTNPPALDVRPCADFAGQIAQDGNCVNVDVADIDYTSFDRFLRPQQKTADDRRVELIGSGDNWMPIESDTWSGDPDPGVVLYVSNGIVAPDTPDDLLTCAWVRCAEQP